MSGTRECVLTLVYLNGDREELRVWDWEDLEKDTNLNPQWVKAWDKQNYDVYGLDPEIDSYIAVNLSALRHLSLIPIEQPTPGDAAPDFFHP